MYTLTHEYELFIMESGKKIQDIEKYFFHIVNHKKTLSKVFQIEDFVRKFLRCLNHIGQPKVTMICEYKDFSYMHLTTFFGKL